MGVGDGLGRTGKASAELHTSRAHFQIARDQFAAPDSAGDKDEVVGGKLRQDLLRQNRRRHRADMATRFHALDHQRSEEHTSDLQSLMRTSYAVFCLKKKKK